ncbi:AbrB/MazE/SpoVT family DNA-binding domain-containing protein [Candidatus Bathyarchaeota archaeon]|nr:AbrB/MazE/SpoVT family DNA-binding domain-containing protein [Candidatus Bathyarchaeota archaeon]
MSDTVEVGKYGRITLPKDLRQRHGIQEKSRIIIRERENQIILIPVTAYDNPTDALYGSVKLAPPVDDPKAEARRYLRGKALEDRF